MLLSHVALALLLGAVAPSNKSIVPADSVDSVAFVEPELAWPSEPLPPGVTGPVVVDALWRCGLTPDVLASAGLTTGQAAPVVTAIAEAIAGAPSIVNTVDLEVSAARAIADPLGSLVLAGTATDQEKAAWSTAKQTLAAAIAARESLFTSLRESATVSLSVSERAAVQSIHGTAETWRSIPAPYRVVARSEAGFLALRESLAQERIALTTGQAVPGVRTGVSSISRSPGPEGPRAIHIPDTDRSHELDIRIADIGFAFDGKSVALLE